MHQAIDRRGRGHLIPEDPIPLREDEIARDADGASLIAFSEEREKNLRLLRTLLDVPDVVQEQHRELIEFPQGAGQLEIALRGQQLRRYEATVWESGTRPAERPDELCCPGKLRVLRRCRPACGPMTT